ncbi:MAG: BamA/TamA family outer membrane protein [Cyclobacteriaceae bacterium]|nr:BamA/TamA family outer membrane protein [Cyclobacteriaceae bacterium]
MRRILPLVLLSILISQVATAQFRRNRAQDAQTPTESTLNYANPVEYTIGGIEVTGLNVLDKNAMISLTGLKIGDKVKIPSDQISGAIRKLWKHGLVGDATILVDRIEGETVYLTIALAERPRLNDFYFTGVRKARISSLKDELNLIRGKIVNDAMIRNTELSVKKFFYKKGFLNTDVKVVQESDTMNRGGVKLRIDIDIKSKVRVHDIIFEGNTNIASSKLKKKMKKTKENARITLHRTILGKVFGFKSRDVAEYVTTDSSRDVSWREAKEFLNENVKLNIFATSKFIRSEYEEDKLKLIDYYNSLGYRDAEIVSDTIVRYSRDRVDVVMKVNEGRKYYFRDITWTGNYIHTAATLNEILDIEKGDVYNRELIDKKTTFNPKGPDISGLYMDDGYLFFRITPVEVAVEGDSIDIEMRIFEGDQATIREVTITGNERTSEHVIRRELSTVPGQKFRRSDIIRTQQQLSQMGFFNPQKIQQDIKPNPANGTVDIGWELEEQSNDQVQLSGGWGGAFGFVGTVGITFNNFSVRKIPDFKNWHPYPTGDGQRLSISAQANGASYQSYSFSFTEPWMGGRKPNSFTVGLNHSISRLATGTFEISDKVSLKQSGITIGLGRRLEWPDNYFSLTNSLSFLVYNYKGNYFNSTVLPEEGKTYSLKLETNLARNSIDSPMYPTQGSTLSLNVALTPPWSRLRDNAYLQDVNEQFKWIEMHKWMFDAKFYLKLLGSSKPDGRSLVLETKAHFGFIGQYKKSLTPSPFERFLVGGDGLAGGFNSFVLGQDIIGLRGYENNLVTPPFYAKRSSSTRTNKIEGGIVYDKFGFELRYPITLSQAATIYVLAFGEGGNNWDNYLDFNPFSIYKSAGFGARIFMPAFGLIGLNWGYGFDKLPGALNKSGAQFHFTIGQQIR